MEFGQGDPAGSTCSTSRPGQRAEIVGIFPGMSFSAAIFAGWARRVIMSLQQGGNSNPCS